MAAIEADLELPGSCAHTLPPTPLGTALHFELVGECLRALDADFQLWNSPIRLATMRAICLCSKAWGALGQCFLYSRVGVSLRPNAVATTSSRSLRLLATLLARRSLAGLIVDFTLRIEGARAIDLLAATSLFDDLSRNSYLEISFGDHEVGHLASKLSLLQHTNRLMLQGPVTPSLARALFCLERIDKLRITGPFPDTCCSSKPAFTLRQLILERETSIASFHTLTSYAIFTLQHLTLTASDSQEPPSLAWFLCLRTLIILQPYRGSKHAQRSRRLEADKLAAFVAAVLGSARRLPLLTFVALRNPDQLGNANWPDMRRSSAQIFGALPYSLVHLGLSTAATSLDLRHVDDLLSDKATRTPALARISMDKTAKALVPRPDDEYERRAAANRVRIVWTASAILSDT